jgi:hypothetical protein
MPIGWRNATGGAAGSPGAALAVANRAFSGITDTAEKKLATLAEEKENQRVLAEAKRNNDFINSLGAEITADELANIPEGIDSALLGAAREKQSNIKADDARARYNTALAEEQEYLALPENRQNREEARKRKEAREEAQLALDNDRHTLNLQREQRLAAELQAAAAERQTTTDINTGFDEHLGEYMAPYKHQLETALTGLQTQEMDPDTRQRKIDDLMVSYTRKGETARNNLMPGYLAMWKQDNPGASRAAIEASRPGAADVINRQRGQARADKLNEAEIDKLEREEDIAASVAVSRKHLSQMARNPTTNAPEFLDKKAAEGNKISKHEAYNFVVGKKGWGHIADWARDTDIPEQYREHIDQILEQTGGNREIFTKVMESVRYDTEALAKDEVHHFPSWQAVEAEVAEYQAAADQINKTGPGRRAPKQESPDDTFLQALRNAAPPDVVGGESLSDRLVTGIQR